MSNDRLRAAMLNAGVESTQLADALEVDAKTIERWVSGRTPYRRHRARVARALGVTPHDLWPEEEPAPGASPDLDRKPEAKSNPTAAEVADELLEVYLGSEDPRLPNRRGLLGQASARIELLGLTLADLIDRDTVQLLRAKAVDGCEVRILLSDPDSAHLIISESEQRTGTRVTDPPALRWQLERTLGYLQPLLSEPGAEVRVYVAERFNSIVRVDEELLATLHLYAAPPVHEPVLHVRRRQDAGLFDHFTGHYNAIWNHAATPLVADPDHYPDPDEHPDRYQPTDPKDAPLRPGGFAPKYRAPAS